MITNEHGPRRYLEEASRTRDRDGERLQSPLHIQESQQT